VSAGMPVEVTFDQTDGTQYLTGVLQSVSFEAASNSNNSDGVAYFPATIRLDSPGTLMPGMGIQYNINAMQLEDCLMVPSSAITYTEGGAAVYVRAETAGQYETVLDIPAESLPEGFVAVPVEIGIADEYNTEIRSGVEEGTEVYLNQTSDMMGMGGVMVSY